MATKGLTIKAVRELKAQIKKELRGLNYSYYGNEDGDTTSILKRINDNADILNRIEAYYNATGEDDFNYEAGCFQQNILALRRLLLNRGIIVKQGKDGLYSSINDTFWTEARKLPFRTDEDLNKPMAEWVEASKMSLRQLADFTGADQNRISAFLHDREDPIAWSQGTWSDSARRLCMGLGCLPEDIFHEKWWKEAKERAYWNYTHDVYQLHKNSFTHNRVNHLELRRALRKALATLTLREAEVIDMRFGLSDGSVMSLEEVAREFNVTRERIRQIEAMALRKLRHPTRLEKLREFDPERTPHFKDAKGNDHAIVEQDIVEYGSDLTQLCLTKVPPYRWVEE